MSSPARVGHRTTRVRPVLPGFALQLWVIRLVREPAVWIAAVAFVACLPRALRVLESNGDVAEYIDIARRLVAGEGYVLGIKGYLIGGTQVIHNGLDARAPLYPVFIAALLTLGLDLLALQVANAVLIGICAALLCAIGSALFGRRTGALAGLLAAVSPVAQEHWVQPVSEPLAAGLVLLAAWLLVRDVHSPRVRPYAVAGAALGLAYLARPASAAMSVALVAGTLLASRSRRLLPRPLLALSTAAAIFIGPITVYSLLTRGSPTFPVQTFMYAVFSDTDVLENPFRRPLSTPVEFIRENRDFVIGAILHSVQTYAGLLFFDKRWLLPLLPAWPPALVALIRGRYPAASVPILLLALTNFAVYAFAWSTYQPRYHILTLFLLLPFAVDGLARLDLAKNRILGLRKLPLVYLVVAVAALSWTGRIVRDLDRGGFLNEGRPDRRVFHGVRWTGPIWWSDDRDFLQVVDWVRVNVGSHEVLAHSYPYAYTLFTGRPSTLLVTGLEPGRLRSFLADYKVAYVLLNTRDGGLRGYLDDLQALAVDGVREVRVGSYRVFDTRALWR